MKSKSKKEYQHITYGTASVELSAGVYTLKELERFIKSIKIWNKTVQKSLKDV